ncbi:MAG: SPOR domain-containing protein [Nitrospirae bacterium]|nr:SPOR domain-containing protein [Nitrospirota bacterium]MBF0540493.1 SPOR domain-containing protein [Nitrospirota bacterium]
MKKEKKNRHLWINIIFTQKKIIILTFLLIFLGAVYVSYHLPHSFEASGTLAIKPKQNSGRITKENLLSVAEILKSDYLIEETLKALQKYGKTPTKDSINDIKSRIKTNIRDISSTIEIKYYDNDKAAAQDFLNALMAQYVTDAMIQAPEGDADDVGAVTPKAKKGSRKAKNQNISAVSPKEEIERNITLKSNLEQQLYTLSNDTIEKTLYIEQFQKAIEGNDWQYFASISTNAAIVDITHSLRKLFIERGTILRQYQEDSFNVKSIDKQIESVQKELKTQLQVFIDSQQNELDIINRKKENIKDIINQIDEKNLALKKQIIASDKMNKDDGLNEIFSNLETKKPEVSTPKGVKTDSGSLITIEKSASVVENQISANKNIIIYAGLIIGLIMGLGIGFIREFFDHTIKNPSDVENYFGMPMLFSLSKLRPSVKMNSLASTKSLVFIALILIFLISLYTANTLYSSTSKKQLPLIEDNTTANDIKDTKLENPTPELIPANIAEVMTTVDKFKAVYSYYDPETEINSMQLYAFSNKESAKTATDRLKSFGINAYVKDAKSASGKGMIHRVLLAPFCYDNSLKKERFIGSINNVSIMVNQSNGEFSLSPESLNNQDAIVITERLSSMGWKSKVQEFKEIGESHYKVIVAKDCN